MHDRQAGRHRGFARAHEIELHEDAFFVRVFIIQMDGGLVSVREVMTPPVEWSDPDPEIETGTSAWRMAGCHET